MRVSLEPSGSYVLSLGSITKAAYMVHKYQRFLLQISQCCYIGVVVVVVVVHIVLSWYSSWCRFGVTRINNGFELI